MMFTMIGMGIVCMAVLFVAVVDILSVILMVGGWVLETSSLYVYVNTNFRSAGALCLQQCNASL